LDDACGSHPDGDARDPRSEDLSIHDRTRRKFYADVGGGCTALRTRDSKTWVECTFGVTAELRAAIRANPNDREPRLVYADWLIEQGDPRGEWIALHAAEGEQAGMPGARCGRSIAGSGACRRGAW
jgi:uncharacterized protein (TIGR02996 family)